MVNEIINSYSFTIILKNAETIKKRFNKLDEIQYCKKKCFKKCLIIRTIKLN